MNANLLSIIKQITAERGEDILENARLLRAFFGDLAKDEPKPLRMAFGKCVENGFYRIIKDTRTAEERRQVIDTLARRLRDAEGLDTALCTEALELLAAAVFGDGGIAPAATPPPATPEPIATVTPAYYLSFNFHESGPFDLPTMERMIANGQITRTYYCRTSPAQEWTPAASFPEFAALFPAESSPPPAPSKPASAKPPQKRPKSTPSSTAAAPAPKPGENMVLVEGGTFMMGSPKSEAFWFSDERLHQVTVSGFYMGKYAVTQREWQELMRTTLEQQRAKAKQSEWYLYGKGNNYPIYFVRWHEALEYCNKLSSQEELTPCYRTTTMNRVPLHEANNYCCKLSSQEGPTHCCCNATGDRNIFDCCLYTWDRNANGYRLPTEAEWEYACRAGTTTPFSTGDNITTDQANYSGEFPYKKNPKGICRAETVEVGSFAPNPWGLYDMHGNIDEWCWDWYGDYPKEAQIDPVGTSYGNMHVIRGGHWANRAKEIRSAARDMGGSSTAGFRLVRSR